MDDLTRRVCDFSESLQEFKAEHQPSWPTGLIYNALLLAAQGQLPEDPVIDGLPQASKIDLPSSEVVTSLDAGTMRAVMTQVLSALGETGPAFSIMTIG
jgi:hypothetical protein